MPEHNSQIESQALAPGAPPAAEPDQVHVSLRTQAPPGVRLRVTVEALGANGAPHSRRQVILEDNQSGETTLTLPVQPGGVAMLLAGLRAIPLEAWLFVAALGIYLFTRLHAIAEYPIYFFTDEAVQTVLASDFLRDGLHNYAKDFLPAYFLNVYQYNLGLSVYLQVLPLQLFGKSVEVTRSVAALATLVGAAGVGLAFRRISGGPAWLAAMLLSITPAWFLHSRTAFETGLAVSLYAAFLYFYLRYRQGNVRSLYLALLSAGLCFYSYSPAQVVLAVTAVLLFFSDLRYHLRQPRWVILATLGLTILLAFPYMRFQMAHPGENIKHLTLIGSYWQAPIPFGEKLGLYFGQYFAGLNPLYWFGPQPPDMQRHTMDGYGHIFWFTLLFLLLGLYRALRGWRKPEYRLVLAALLAAPSGAALVQLGITRTLFMVIPAALLSGLGLVTLLDWAAKRWRWHLQASWLALFILAGMLNLFMLNAALSRGPRWSSEYGLNGMQYGARQVFGEVRQMLADSPDIKIVVSPTWANGADVLARFFFTDPIPFKLAGIDSYLTEYTPFEPGTVFILPPEEYQRALKSGKFSTIQELKTLPWPDGQPGFYLVTLQYVDNFAEIFRQEMVDRQAMIEGEAMLGGEKLAVHFSRLDIGTIQHVFDGNLNTMARTMAANPLKLQVDFPSPRRLSGVALGLGSTASTIDISVQESGASQVSTFHLQVEEASILRTVEMPFDRSYEVISLFISLKNTHDPEPGHVHLWEIIFR